MKNQMQKKMIKKNLIIYQYQIYKEQKHQIVIIKKKKKNFLKMEVKVTSKK